MNKSNHLLLTFLALFLLATQINSVVITNWTYGPDIEDYPIDPLFVDPSTTNTTNTTTTTTSVITTPITEVNSTIIN
jgi:hypothetical protein